MLRSMTEVERQASGLNVLAEVRANLQAGLDPLERPTNARAARANDGDAATVRLSAGRSRTPGAASSLCCSCGLLTGPAAGCSFSAKAHEVHQKTRWA